MRIFTSAYAEYRLGPVAMFTRKPIGGSRDRQRYGCLRVNIRAENRKKSGGGRVGCARPPEYGSPQSAATT